MRTCVYVHTHTYMNRKLYLLLLLCLTKPMSAHTYRLLIFEKPCE